MCPTEDRSLRKRLVRSGQGEGSSPRPGQEVTVKLLGVLEDRSLVEKDPGLSFVLGQGGAVQVRLARVGGGGVAPASWEGNKWCVWGG